MTERFTPVPSGGYYRDPRTGHAVCAACLREGHVIHLMKATDSAFMCMACHTAYRAGVMPEPPGPGAEVVDMD